MGILVFHPKPSHLYISNTHSSFLVTLYTPVTPSVTVPSSTISLTLIVPQLRFSWPISSTSYLFLFSFNVFTMLSALQLYNNIFSQELSSPLHLLFIWSRRKTNKVTNQVLFNKLFNTSAFRLHLLILTPAEGFPRSNWEINCKLGKGRNTWLCKNNIPERKKKIIHNPYRDVDQHGSCRTVRKIFPRVFLSKSITLSLSHPTTLVLLTYKWKKLL